MNRINKKAQSLGGLYSGILVIAAIGIMLALVLYILSGIGDSLMTKNTAASKLNDSTLRAGIVNATGGRLDARTLPDVRCTALTKVYNGTTGSINIAIGNFTVSPDCVVKNSSSMATYTATSFSVSYTYTYSKSTESSNATGTIITQFVDFLPWLGIILLVLAAGVVLFFVIRSFSGGAKGV